MTCYRAVCPSFIEYVTWFALLFCAMGILYEVYEKFVEYKILEEVERISEQLLKIVPSTLLDATPASLQEAMKKWKTVSTPQDITTDLPLH